MKKINEQLDMFAGSEDVYKDAVENMKSVRKLAAERLKEREKAAKDLEKATATKKVRLQGTKEPKLPKNHYTERLDVVNRKELAKLVESAKKEGKKFKVSRSLKEGFRYTLMLEGKLEEARGKGKGQKLDKYFKLVNRLHKDKLTEEEVAEINKAIDEVKSFEPAGEWEEKDKKNLLDQLTMVLDVVDVPIKEEFERKNLINLPQSVQDALYDWAETGVDAHLLSKEGDNFIFDFETYNKFLEVCDSPESYWENWVDVDKYETFHPKDLLKTLVEHYGAKEEDIKGISDTEVKEAALFVETEVIEEYHRKYATEDLEESKKLKEDNALNKSKYKALIGRHFNHSFDFEFLDVVANTLDRIDFPLENEEEDVFSAIDDALTYNADRWTIAKHYVSNPADLNWDDVISEFGDDIEELARKINKGDIDESLTENRTVKEVSHSIDDNGTLSIYVDGRVLSTISDCGEMSQEEISSLINDELADKDIIVESLTEDTEPEDVKEIDRDDVAFLFNNRQNLIKYLGSAKELKDAIDVGKDVYGSEGYRKEDKYVVIDKTHPFGIALYSTSDDKMYDEILGDIKESLDDVKDPTHKLDEALKIITELSEFEPWSGAIDTWDKIINAGYEQELEDLLEEWYPEGITITELNDLLWHDGEDLLDHLGIEDTEELDLPTEVTTTVEEIGYGKQEIEENDEIVSDWLSDEYGFTHYGFNYYVNDDNEVIITDIEWDTSESYYKNSKRDKLFEDFVKNDILSSDDAEYIKDSTSWVTNPDRLVVELLDEMINAGASLNAVVPILKEHGLDTDRIIADGAREKADSIDIANAPVDYSLDDDIGVEPPVDFEATDNGDLEVDGEFEWVDDEYGWDFEENLVPVDEDANPLSHKNLSVLWDKYHDEDKVIGELEKLGLDIDRGDLQGVVEAFVLMLDEEPQDIPESKPLKEDLKRKPLKEQKGKYNIIASVSGLQESVIKKTDNLTEALNFVQAVEDKYLYALVVEGTTGRIITDFPEE